MQEVSQKEIDDILGYGGYDDRARVDYRPDRVCVICKCDMIVPYDLESCPECGRKLTHHRDK